MGKRDMTQTLRRIGAVIPAALGAVAIVIGVAAVSQGSLMGLIGIGLGAFVLIAMLAEWSERRGVRS